MSLGVKLLLGVAVLTGLLFYSSKSGALGIRNNNPLNIRIGNDWVGEGVADNNQFEGFISPEYGIRAGVKILQSYQRRGMDTLAEIISTWAPPNENNTQQYIVSVSGRAGLTPETIINSSHYASLISAMIWHENGENPYSIETIQKGIALA